MTKPIKIINTDYGISIVYSPADRLHDRLQAGRAASRGEARVLRDYRLIIDL